MILSACAACSSLECKEATALMFFILINVALVLEKFFDRNGIPWLSSVDASAKQQLQKFFSSSEKDISLELQIPYSIQLCELADKLELFPESAGLLTFIHWPENYLLALDKTITKMDAAEKKKWLENFGEMLKEMTRVENKIADNYYYYYYNDNYLHTTDYLAFRRNLPMILFLIVERKADFDLEDIKKAIKGCICYVLECFSRLSSTVRDKMDSGNLDYSCFYLDTLSNFITQFCSLTVLTEIIYHKDLLTDEDERRKILKSIASIYISCLPALTFPDTRFEVPADKLFEKKIKKEDGDKQIIEIDLGSVTRANLSNPAAKSSLVFLQLEDGGDWYEDYFATYANVRTDFWVFAKRIKVVLDASSLGDDEQTIYVKRWSECMAPFKTLLQYFYIKFEQSQTDLATRISEMTDIETFSKQTELLFEIDDVLQNSRWWHSYMGYLWILLKKVSFKIEEAQFNRGLFYDNFYKVVRYTISYWNGKTYARGTAR
jgi:hypothetical protein